MSLFFESSPQVTARSRLRTGWRHDRDRSAPIVSRPSPAAVPVKGSRLSNLLRTTDHKTIGLMYMAVAFTFFVIAGIMALLMRTELAQPGMQFLSPEQYNQLFTMHGTLMLLMFATPLFFAFGNLIMPLQIGAPDVAFPRLNALSFWLFTIGSTIVLSSASSPPAGRRTSAGRPTRRCRTS